MSHWDDGRLMALADGELDSTDSVAAEKHLAACEACRVTLALLHAQRDLLREAFSHAREPAPADRVRDALRARSVTAEGTAIGTARETSTGLRGLAARTWWEGRTRLAQAALLVLLLAGGASALVLGPSLRSRLFEADAPDERPTPAVAVEGELEIGTRVGPVDGRVTVTLNGLPSGAEVRVSLVDGEGAQVLAPGGTRFRSGNGRIEAEASAGPVSVQLPRALAGGSLEVGGRVYLTVTEGLVRLEVPAFQQSPSEVRFRVP